MDPRNGTAAVSEFILLGLMDGKTSQSILFVLFLLSLLVTTGGNLSIILAILLEPQLHNPMYFFLGNLSLTDIGCITVTVPHMLGNLLSWKKTISFAGCLAQLFFFHLLAGANCFLLTAMAYDRYLAICHPLDYSSRMKRSVQMVLVGASWACAFTNALTHTVAMSTLYFCGPNIINHFFCDIPPLFQLSCSSTRLNQLLLFVAGIFMALIPIGFLVLSYTRIVAAILRLRSAEGRRKTFSTCASHLTVVCIFYGTGIFSYMRLGSVDPSEKDKVIGILNSVISPMLNPLIYSLRNAEVKGALRKAFTGRRPV
ncbi:olfactory receptor 3A3-like [Tachyglossus aculeatus]|uniref:olfactory receptor 3A3-like n=1 Tax=Tachyglossus aculeatus TaxID=9261 RepID=UPI0018F33BA6|nr:olfactory receptor 3A3-like [Tachyglossus aculeatus]